MTTEEIRQELLNRYPGLKITARVDGDMIDWLFESPARSKGVAIKYNPGMIPSIPPVNKGANFYDLHLEAEHAAR